MIPELSATQHVEERYQAFLAALQQSRFEGRVRCDYATRLVTATDNSVYQVLPQAVVYPQSTEDVQCLGALLAKPEFRAVKVSPRGGGTGTNGQSLSDGVVIDLSREMREILEVNLDQMWVRVQPGVVLDQLNAQLAPHGVFFAPNLSPSSRATIGGMISTDASGKGSRIYGKTSDHVLAMTVVLGDGSLLQTRPLANGEVETESARTDRAGRAYRGVRAVLDRARNKFRSKLPELERFLTGYDLNHTELEDGRFDLGRVITGSEGTLGFVTEAKLRLTRLPQHRTLLAIRYASFDDALRAAEVLVASDPGAIETVDDTIVSLAKQDVIWTRIAHLVGGVDEPPMAAINLVEFESDEAAHVDAKVAALTATLDAERASGSGAIGYTVATAANDIAALWSLRKKGVGLLGNTKGERRPVPFVEDTAVPPHRLAEYITEFRALLDRHGLRYGMFGHVDVGCLHVRPALDLRDPNDEALLSRISDEVVALVQRFGGVLWGEHGKGYRSQYTPTFFGGELYEELRAVKAAFDPHNQLNPGKLATPQGSKETLLTIRQPTRGSRDREIPSSVRARYDTSIHCNGNGACFDWNPDSIMCPSSKVTRDRIHSPKGRAGILREWLRLMAAQGDDAGTSLVPGASPGTALLTGRKSAPDDFSHEVYDAMDGCLACKACATQCPVKVDIPELRSRFIEQYHTRYRRPLKDFFVAALEALLSVMALWPALTRWMMQHRLSTFLLDRVVGLVDTPAIASRPLAKQLRGEAFPRFDYERLQRLSDGEKRQTVLVAQDAFTSFYEPAVAMATVRALAGLGLRVVVLPWRQNGKGLHVKGFVAAFARLARRNARFFRKVAKLGIPIVGIEPAVTLTYREEYRQATGDEAAGFGVQLLQEYLHERLPGLLSALGDRAPRLTGEYRLYAHCTERTSVPTATRQWSEIFAQLGATLVPEDVGCCGMCGVFGHERAHVEESRGIFAMSWRPKLQSVERPAERVCATGHSCRSQVERQEGYLLRHPIEILAAALTESPAELPPPSP
ncbi:MAG: FAD-binding and (Fe-S)-binding domain-containing protein [Myxococcota bacterium]